MLDLHTRTVPSASSTKNGNTVTKKASSAHLRGESCICTSISRGSGIGVDCGLSRSKRVLVLCVCVSLPFLWLWSKSTSFLYSSIHCGGESKLVLNHMPETTVAVQGCLLTWNMACRSYVKGALKLATFAI